VAGAIAAGIASGELAVPAWEWPIFTASTNELARAAGDCANELAAAAGRPNAAGSAVRTNDLAKSARAARIFPLTAS